jgi:ATPase subunit of ABC transporter with duplicated ATPase domains
MPRGAAPGGRSPGGPRLTAAAVTFSYGAQLILDGVDLTIGAGDRIGVVAPNGVGKSTFLKILAGDLVPDSGTVTRAPATTSVIRLAQEPDIRQAESLADHLARRTGVAAAQHALDDSLAALSQAGAAGGQADEAYASALDHWLALGGADLPERAAQVTAELGLDPGLLADRRSAELSGGQKARLALAAVLLALPDILLLDEPTNDLDDQGLGRLEEHLRASRAGIVLISHDRAVLAGAVSKILEIDEFSRRGTLYTGGWDAFVAERELARRRAVESYATYENQREQLVDTARTQRQWARSGVQRAANPRHMPDGDKHIKAAWIAGAERTAGKAARADRAIERLDKDAPEQVLKPWRLQLAIADAGRAGEVVVQLTKAVVSRGDVTLGPIDLIIGPADRIRITGPNGSGKTTLVDALLGRAELQDGRRYAGPRVVFGELDQSRREFTTDMPVVGVVRAATGLDESDARTLLAKFRLAGDTALRSAAALSPGERTRAALALLQARGVNCLVLDEPTNHLDIEAIEQLEQALEAYRGTLILVTHDRRLAEAIRTDQEIDVTALRAVCG